MRGCVRVCVCALPLAVSGLDCGRASPVLLPLSGPSPSCSVVRIYCIFRLVYRSSVEFYSYFTVTVPNLFFLGVFFGCTG